MQRPAVSRSARILVTAAFAAAFSVGAIAIFAITGAIGAALGSARLPLEWRIGLAGVLLLPLAAIDLIAITKSTYCPVGWRRQTPRSLMRGHSIPVVASVWGFDTGLLVTTIRVAAVSWGALSLAALGLSPQWTGVSYALGFTIPFLILLTRPRLGRAARESSAADPGLESMLRKRRPMQALSALCLAASGAMLIGSVLG